MAGRGWSNGSLWFRWDPHLHTPGTLRNDQYSKGDEDAAWVAFFQAIRQATPAVAAIGVTDYLSLSSYKKFLAGRPPDLKSLFVFANVEMRLTIETDSRQPVNLHLLISPEEDEHVRLAEEQLSRLMFKFGPESYPCADEGLMRLGRAYLQDPAANPAKALSEGVNQFKPTLDSLRQLFHGSEWLRRNVLVGISAGKDGLGGFSKDSGFWALRQEMGRFADVIFSGQPNERRFWLDEAKLLESGLSRKPCLHGSDAHEIARVLKPAEDRLCWIKGNVSFETLRQTLAEPERRVWIGAQPPSEPTGANAIRSLRVESAPWLKTSTIGLNSGLVTVIGAKGSGKTALADLLALAADSMERAKNPASFLQKAKEFLGSIHAQIDWSDGSDSGAGANENEDWFWEDQGRVQYLSQQFVERLSAADGLAEPLIDEIERVVFSAIPLDQRMETLTLQDLRDLLLADTSADAAFQRAVIEEQTRVIAQERAVRDSLKQRQGVLEEAQRAIKVLDEQLKKLPVSAGAEAKIADMAKVSTELDQLERRIASHDRTVVALRGVIAEVHRIEQQAANQVDRSRSAGQPDLLPDDIWRSLTPTVPSTAYQEVQKLVVSTQQAIDSLRANGTKGADGTPGRSLAVLQGEKARLQKELGEFDSRTKARAQIEGKLPAARQQVTKATSELEFAQGAVVRISEATHKRLAAYEAVFGNLDTEEQTLRTLYEPLLERLASDPKLDKLSFNVGRVVDLDSWVARGERLFDLRTGSFQGRGSLQRIAEAELLPAWRTGDPSAVRVALGTFYQQYLTPPPPYASGTTPADVGNWLFSTEHIEVQYGIDFEKVPISRLSPGTRGIVLLMLYLGLDKWDLRPLVIDQPEENLDPSSVQNDLVPFFRDAAMRRQIIMVTHNANLVVNTDSDQVIVASSVRHTANALPDITYHAGGLEDPKIREDVCNLLEGGSEAFRKRGERYGVKHVTWPENLPPTSDGDAAIAGSR